MRKKRDIKAYSTRIGICGCAFRGELAIIDVRDEMTF